MPTDRVHCPHQQAQPRIRTPPHGQALHHWACAHVVEGLLMRLWSRPLIVAGIGVVPQEPEEGPAAVPVGGGRAWPGFEIDHSERSSRVAISRAGRRPPAHTAARPNKTSHAAAGPGRASRRHAEPIISTPCSTGVEDTGGRPRCRWAVAGPGRASRSTTPSEARVWRSRGRAAAHRHQHAGTNTQPQTHRHNEAARPHRGRAAHASGRYAAISEVFSASGCRWRPGARRPRRRGRPCRPRPTCPTYAGRTAS